MCLLMADDENAQNELHSFLGKHPTGEVATQSFSTILDSRLGDEKEFLRFYEGNNLCLTWSFSEYVERINGLIDRFQDCFSLPPGSAVIVFMGNSPESFLSYGALLACGLKVVPVDPTETDFFISNVIQTSHASGMFCFSGKSWPGIKTWALKWEDCPRIYRNVRGPGTEGCIFFTSGTTGNAKGVEHAFGSLLSNLMSTARVGELSSHDRLFSCLSLFHVNAFNFSFLLPLYLGCSVVYCNRFPLRFWKIIADERVTVGSISPPVIRLLVKSSFNHAADLTSLRYFISASSSLYQEELRQFIDRFRVKINQAYGLSETVNFTLFTPPSLSDEIYEKAMFSEKKPSAGIPVWGNEVQLMREDNGLIDDDLEVGELVVRGWNVMKGYINNPSATSLAFMNGWFHSGDLAYRKTINEQSFYYICGRLKEVVKRNGKLIYLAEVDDAIKLIGLDDACAVGFENDYTEQEVGIYIVKESTLMDESLILHKLRQVLSYAKSPKVIVWGQRIPKTSVGKIQRQSLSASFGEYKTKHFYE